MKLTVDFASLWRNVHMMGAVALEFDPGIVWDGVEDLFDDQLSRSMLDIALDDLGSEQGLLSVKGRQVVLFISDHGYYIDAALEDAVKGRKFHVAECVTLDEMRKKNRFQRYKITNNLSGDFPIFGTSKSGNAVEAVSRLKVCQNCLKSLNYKGFNVVASSERRAQVDTYSLEEFFSTYSSVFKSLPKQLVEQARKGYSNDWNEISMRLRQAANFVCTACLVDLSGHKNLLHVHHKNGEKSDNSGDNLVVLCSDCHRKEPFHGHLYLKHADVQLINRLRKAQSLCSSDNDAWEWKDVDKYADPAVGGVISYARAKGFEPPVVGFEIADSAGRVVVELELGWPSRRFGVYLGDKPADSSWRLLSLLEAIDELQN